MNLAKPVASEVSGLLGSDALFRPSLPDFAEATAVASQLCGSDGRRFWTFGKRRGVASQLYGSDSVVGVVGESRARCHGAWPGHEHGCPTAAAALVPSDRRARARTHRRARTWSMTPRIVACCCCWM